MTNPTLERAARAAYDHPAAFEKDCWVDLPDGLDLTSVVVDGYINLIELARAVLMAVREPGIEASREGMNGVALRSPTVTWQCMIDAILNDGGGDGYAEGSTRKTASAT